MTPTRKHINWLRTGLYVLSSASLFIWFISLTESDIFTYKWLLRPGFYLAIMVYAFPVIAFQFLCARFLLANRQETVKTVLSTVMGLAAGFVLYMGLEGI